MQRLRELEKDQGLDNENKSSEEMLNQGKATTADSVKDEASSKSFKNMRRTKKTEQGQKEVHVREEQTT